MFKKNYNKLPLFGCIVIMAAIITGILFSQPVPKNRPDPKMREEIKAYVSSNIMPELAVWKAKFDKALSKEDLAALDKVRAKAKEVKKAEKEKMKNIMMERKSGGKPMDREAMMKERAAGKEQLIALGKEIKPLAEKYQSVLKDIGAIAKPKFDSWKEAVKKINEKYPEPENRRAMPMGILGLNDKNHKRLAVMFMLWDGTDELLPPEGDDAMPPMMGNQVLGLNDMNWNDITSGAYPNPFSENTTIKFNLIKAEKVTISVIDNAGTVVKTITEDYTVGEHSIQFNGTDKNNVSLPNGTYTYKITSPTLNKTGKLVLTK